MCVCVCVCFVCVCLFVCLFVFVCVCERGYEGRPNFHHNITHLYNSNRSRPHSQSDPNSRLNPGGWNRLEARQRVQVWEHSLCRWTWCSHILCTSVSGSPLLSPHSPPPGWRRPRPPPRSHRCSLKKLGRR